MVTLTNVFTFPIEITSISLNVTGGKFEAYTQSVVLAPQKATPVILSGRPLEAGEVIHPFPQFFREQFFLKIISQFFRFLLMAVELKHLELGGSIKFLLPLELI